MKIKVKTYSYQNLGVRKQIDIKTEVRRMGWLQKGTGEFFGVMELSHIQTVVWLYNCMYFSRLIELDIKRSEFYFL